MSDRSATHQAWSDIACRKCERTDLVQLVSQLLDRFGGPAGFAKFWHQSALEASSLRKLRAAESLVKLMNYLAREPELLSHLEDLELAEELRRNKIQAIREALRSEPALVEALAAQEGFVLVPA